ncbi:MAG: hypothetical protein JO345_34505 [Streptosporangiaceae bacterium]|nr:hypothetical protein [Streptosporangiaceae bacterium]
MMLSFEEWWQFHDYWARSLATARDPERVVRLIDEQFGEHRQRVAHDTLALAAQADHDGDPAAVPDEPAPGAWCAWCGKTGGPFEDESMGGPPSYVCPTSDPELSAACMARHEARVLEWCEVAGPTAQMPYPHVIVRRAGDLFDTANARARLDAADAAQAALRGWRAVNPPPVATQAADKAPAPVQAQPRPAPAAPPPAPAPVDFTRAHWAHTLRNPANRAHTQGHLNAIMHQGGTAPAKSPDDRKTPPRRRRRGTALRYGIGRRS